MIVLKRLRAENFKLLRQVDLVFPRQGSVLVEGLNESGKSTLFESMFYALYGTPLIMEGRGRGNLESVIRYGAGSMLVELTLEVDQSDLLIRRSLKRGRSSQASLAVRRPGGLEEQVSGVTAVNERVVEELGGLDGDALLNSCFVEQKKISKLEDLGAAQRRESLRKLLNLDRLTALAERFKVTTAEEKALGEARARLELAEVSARLPRLAGERVALESRLGGVVLPALEWRNHGGTEYTASLGKSPLPLDRSDSPLPEGEGQGEGTPRPDVGAGSPRPGRDVDPRLRGDDVEGGGDGGDGGGDDETHRALRTTHSREAGDEPPPYTIPPGDGEAWEHLAEKLEARRKEAGDARARGRILVALAAAGVLATGAMLVAGVELGGLLLVALGVVGALAVLALLAFRAAGGPELEATKLQSKLASRRDSILSRMGDLEGRRARLEAALGVQGASLDAEECHWEVRRMAREIAVKRRAAAIVEGTMERIVRLVLPNTERNLGQILPLLTAGRYHEARIGADYQIQVWDDSAGRYVSKNVFSGGARDQFSLALRLAFALATLPEELGTTPGFIFLDEPLSSFDGPRTEALVRLVTTGQVAASFSQIFVISHSRSFDPSAFQYRLEMRDGRVVESNLPSA